MITTDTGPIAPKPLTADDYDTLDAILDDLRTRDEEIPQWEFCEGFMAALICCRHPIRPSEYLPVLLGPLPESGGEPSVFADAAQFQRFSDLWLQHWAAVTAALDAPIESLDDARAYDPQLMDLRSDIAALSPKERDELGDLPIPSFGQVWAVGFMYAVENWPQEWAAPRDRELARLYDAALQDIVTLTEDDGEPLSTSDAGKAAIQLVSTQRLDMIDNAFGAVYDLRMLWRSIGPRIAKLNRGANLGRNDPCSCGSGKKYKKCCAGNSPSLFNQ